MHELQKSRWYVIIILVIIIIVNIAPVKINYITNRISAWSYPLLNVAEQCKNHVHEWKRKRNTTRELELQLHQKNAVVAQLQAEIIALKSTQQEANITQQLRGFCARYNPEQYIIGRVIKHITTDDEQSIIVDIGLYHGVTNDMIAIADNCLIGHVESVFPYHVKIITIADRRSKIPIQCLSSGAAGIYTGTNHSNAGELLFISHLNTLVTDDIIVTSGDGYTYPAGFAVGKITTFSLDNQSLHYLINVSFLRDITTVTHVALLKSSSLPTDLKISSRN